MPNVKRIKIGDVSHDVEDSTARSSISVLEPTAASSDVGKFLKVKTVTNGKVSEYEFGFGGGETATVEETLNYLGIS